MIRLAGCIIKNKENKILLIHRNTEKRKQWELPGGKIDEGENSEEAAVRELKEELGIDVDIIRKIGEKEFNEDNFTMKYMWFEAKIIEGEPKLMEEKFDQLNYFSISELNDMQDNLSANLKNLILEKSL